MPYTEHTAPATFSIHCWCKASKICPPSPFHPTSQKQEHPTLTTFLKNINLLLKYICRLCVKKDVHIHTLAHKLCCIFHQTEKENNFCKVKNLNTQAFICMLTVSNHLTAELIKENIPPPPPPISLSSTSLLISIAPKCLCMPRKVEYLHRALFLTKHFKTLHVTDSILIVLFDLPSMHTR